MYLAASSSISYQPQIQDEHLWDSLIPITADSEMMHPDYKRVIKPAQLRRMSDALKMGVVGGRICLNQAGVDNPDAIIIGTGLGCVRDTLKFMNAVVKEEESGLSPTAFIQSTHNSIAGQLALHFGCHGYNITHVQGSRSLAYAFTDAEMLLKEGDADTILVGAVDERTDELVEMLSRLSSATGHPLPIVTGGAAFFVASRERRKESLARIVGIEMDGSTSVADLILTNVASELPRHFSYTRYSGEHFSAIGFGIFLALKTFETGVFSAEGQKLKDPQLILVHHRLFGQEQSIMLERI